MILRSGINYGVYDRKLTWYVVVYSVNGIVPNISKL